MTTLKFCPHAIDPAYLAPCGKSPAADGQSWFKVRGAIDQTVLICCGECQQNFLAGHAAKKREKLLEGVEAA